MVCKTRCNSLLHQGMDNWTLNLGLLLEIVLSCLVCYVPYMNRILKTYPLKPEWWLPGLSYAIIILIYEELRKWWVRRHPDGWWNRENSY
ncbi:Sodium/potassium-transporting ATPase subunit alpha [Formica fusca]